MNKFNFGDKVYYIFPENSIIKQRCNECGNYHNDRLLENYWKVNYQDLYISNIEYLSDSTIKYNLTKMFEKKTHFVKVDEENIFTTLQEANTECYKRNKENGNDIYKIN